MHTTSSDMITWGKMARKAPRILQSLPRAIRGLRLSKVSSPTQACGLGWSVEQATQRNPDGTALLYENSRFSYLEMNQRANRIAHYLALQGIGKGDVIGIFLENRPELLFTVLGAAKLGAICAMLNTSQTRDVLAHSLKLVNPAAVVVGEELLGAYAEVREQIALPPDRTFFVAEHGAQTPAPGGYLSLLEESRNQPVHNPASTQQVFADDPCFYIYTSGTTGLPKAGIFKHGRWMKTHAGFGIIALDMRPQDVLYCTLPLYHGTGLCVCWGSAVAGAGALAIRRKFSASAFWVDVRKFRATTIGYVGELCRYLLDQPPRPDDADNPVVKMVGNGLRPGVGTPFKARFGIGHVCEFYAASEGNIGFSNVLNFDNTIGFSLMSWALVEYDQEKGEPVRDSHGFLKRVAKGGQGLLLAKVDDKAPLDGYTDPEKTRQVILQDVFEKGDRYFNTGDMLRDIGWGHAQFVDRLGDTFRWKGENVSTTEVENLLLQHPRIAEAVVYGVEVPNTNGRAGMAALTLADADQPLDLDDLLRFAQGKLPHYAVPLFIRLRPDMETTGTFKYQKKALKQQAFDPGQSNGEPIYAWLPGTSGYRLVDAELFQAIGAGQHRY
ncbi:long-chain-acyl-CoA synthetase [Pseudomonas benzenivorans]|uniref:Long-chain-acyl-CoA synthetase n=1 Tax=Pseudomonas benzenivorans TaxID=556533 RepID=A0ABZ0PYS5_9PSED|nr:long-chain-acyl-CoA synthetase [Pseudomonas benzenivorans]WPC06081.1 long-chain-acyl-CoA synthetase [Pseudomonas benzenivorans]